MHGSTARVEADDEEPRGPRPRRRVTSQRADEMFDRQRTPASALPDPTPLVLNLARCVIEIMAGVRDPEQIARWLEPSVYAQLLTRTILAARARQATGRRTALPTISMGSCRIHQPAEDAVEAVAVVHTPTRARAVVMRLIGIDGRWRAAELAVL